MNNLVKFLVVTMLFLAACMGCKEDSPMVEQKDDDGVVTFKSELWRTPTAPEGGINFTAGVFTPVYRDMFISTINLGDQTEIAAFDVNTGEIRWRWRDFIGNDINLTLISVKWPYAYDNQLVFHFGNRGYCIDMDTGQTIWKKEFDYGNEHSHVSGFEEHYYFAAQSTNYDSLNRIVITSFKTDVSSGQEQEMPYAPFEYLHHDWEKKANWYTGGTAFEKDGIEYFVSTYQRITGHYDITASLNLYNVSDDTWVYTQKVLQPPSAANTSDGLPIVEDGVVLNSVGKHICANDLLTGDSLWAKEHAGNFLFGGFFVHDGFVYALAEADALYCYDLQTGDECWRMDDDGLGTASRMVHMNGVIYFRSGGNGRLMAVDMETGELLWNLRSPDAEIFMPDVAVYPGENGEKGKVLAATYLGALCYEAIR